MHLTQRVCKTTCWTVELFVDQRDQSVEGGSGHPRSTLGGGSVPKPDKTNNT